jgi:hypothetical protein
MNNKAITVMKIPHLIVLTFAFLTNSCSSMKAHVSINQCPSSQKFQIVEGRFPSGGEKLFRIQKQRDLKAIAPDNLSIRASKEKWGLMTVDGQLIHPPKWKYLDAFFEGKARFETHDGKFGFLDEAGHIIIPPQFDNASRFNEGLAAVQIKGKWGYIDHSGKIVIPLAFGFAKTFYEGRAFVISADAVAANRFDPKARGGFIDKTGKLVTEEKFYPFSRFSEGKAFVDYDAGEGVQNGILDLAGNLVRLTNVGVDASLVYFHYGLAPAIDKTPLSFPEKLVESVFDPFNESRREYKYGFINHIGQFKIKPTFSNVDNFNYCVAAVKQNNRWGLIDTEGNFLMTPQFEHKPTYLGFGLVRVEAEKRTVKENVAVKINGTIRNKEISRYKSRYGIMNLQGSWIGPPDKSFIGDFNEGMLHFEQNGKSGFMDTTGKVVIEPKFDSAMPFVNDQSYVTIGDEQGYIDREGKLIWRAPR